MNKHTEAIVATFLQIVSIVVSSWIVVLIMDADFGFTLLSVAGINVLWCVIYTYHRVKNLISVKKRKGV